MMSKIQAFHDQQVIVILDVVTPKQMVSISFPTPVRFQLGPGLALQPCGFVAWLRAQSALDRVSWIDFLSETVVALRTRATGLQSRCLKHVE